MWLLHFSFSCFEGVKLVWLGVQWSVLLSTGHIFNWFLLKEKAKNKRVSARRKLVCRHQAFGTKGLWPWFYTWSCGRDQEKYGTNKLLFIIINISLRSNWDKLYFSGISLNWYISFYIFGTVIVGVSSIFTLYFYGAIALPEIGTWALEKSSLFVLKTYMKEHMIPYGDFRDCPQLSQLESKLQFRSVIIIRFRCPLL